MDCFKHSRKMDAVRTAEANGEVADSMDVRKALIAKMNAGEMTLDQVKAELARIKRCAKGAGKITRAAAYRGA